MRGLRLGLSLGRGQAGTPAPFSIAFTGLSTDSIGLYGQVGNHAAIGYTIDPDNGTETVKWSNSSNPADAATYGTGAAPTDFTASDGSPVYLHVTDGGDTVTRSFTVRKAPATGGADLDLAFPEDSAISATDLLANWTTNGNTLTFVSVSPALPTGLSIDSAGEMTGTPTTVTADATYTLTMEDEYGRETSDTFTLEITAVVNPDFTNLTFADPGTGTPDTLTATYTYAGADTLVAYVATRNGGTALTAAQLAAGTGTFLERVVVDPFSVATFNLTGFTATSEAATRIDMAIAEKNNGGISTAREVTVSGLDFTAPTRSSIATDAVDGTTVIVTYSENIYGTEDTADWTISGHTVSNVAISGTTVTLTITPAIANGDSDTLSYSGGDLADGDGNAVATFTTQAITNNVPSSAVDATVASTGQITSIVTSRTLTAVDLGTAVSDREFLVFYAGRLSAAFSASDWQASVGAVTSTSPVVTQTPGTQTNVVVWRLAVPSGTSADIAITRVAGSGFLNGGVMGAIRLTGTPTLGTPTVAYDANFAGATGDESPDYVLTASQDVAAGSALAVFAAMTAGSGVAFTGSTEIVDGGWAQGGGAFGFDANVSAATPRTIVGDFTGAGSTTDGLLVSLEIAA